MTDRKYSVTSIGSRIDGFLRPTLQAGGFKVNFEILDVETADGDVETPDVMVKFTGSDVDALLSNRAELLLALEHVTMEMLRMPSEDHSRISFDANDYRLLRIEELRLSAMTAAENVKRTGTPFRFNPMGARERRIRRGRVTEMCIDADIRLTLVPGKRSTRGDRPQQDLAALRIRRRCIEPVPQFARRFPHHVI